MKIIHYLTGTNDPASNRRAVFCVLLAVLVFIGIVVLGSASTVNASTQPKAIQQIAAQSARQDPLLLENDKLTEELTSALERLDALSTERDALFIRAETAAAEAAQYRQELEVLQQENSLDYVLRFRVERNIKFPEDSEVLYFTRTVDEDTYNKWQEGNEVTESISFITTPSDGLLHEWVVVLEDKYITVQTE